MPLKANKVTHVSKFLYELYDRKFPGGFQHTKNQNTQDPVLSSLTANYVWPPFVIFRVFDAPSETVNEQSSHHPHLLLTSQHKNADVSFFDLRLYIPEITGVRSSKLPPLLKGGKKRVIITLSKL